MESSAHSLADWLLVSHKMLGFVTILLIAPSAVLVTLGGRAHRRLGLAYVTCMTLLYVSGTYFTFAEHHLLGYRFLRNLSFNLFGYSMVLLGWRAMPLKREDGGRVTRIDRALVAFLVTLGLLMLPLGFKRWPMFVFGLLGLALGWVDWREIRSGALSAAQRLERHVRYMVASYFYLVTVVSILVFPGTHKLKWVWPSAVAGAIVVLLTRHSLREGLGWTRGGTTRLALRVSAAVAVGMGIAALYQFASSGTLLAGMKG